MCFTDLRVHKAAAFATIETFPWSPAFGACIEEPRLQQHLDVGLAGPYLIYCDSIERN